MRQFFFFFKFVCLIYLPKNVFITLPSLLRLSRFFLRSPTSFESLVLFFFLPPLMRFSHPVAKSVEPQLSDHSPLSHRSLPTSSSCYCGQSSSLVLPATAPFPVLEGKTEQCRGMERGMGLGEGQKKESGRESEREHICQNSSKTLGEAEKAAGSCS